MQLPERRYLLGLLALFAVVLIWVSTSFVINNVFGDQHFERPFFITYFSTSTFSLYLIPLGITRMLQRHKTTHTPLEHDAAMERLLDQDEDDELMDGVVTKMTIKETLHLSSYFCILWFLANYCTNASLAYTTVGSSTILSSMSGLFTLTLGVMVKVERFTWIKMLSVGISIVGVMLVSWSDQVSTVSTHNKLVGDLFALAGAMFYGIYTVLLKLWIKDESRIDMFVFFGFVGLLNVVLLWPFFFLLHWTHIESFSLPYNSTLWTMITLNALIGTLLSDYLWLLAMLMTSPLVVTLGITLTVPLALIGDIVIKHILPGLKYSIGACLVIAGFFAVNIGSLQSQPKTVMDQEETHEMIPRE